MGNCAAPQHAVSWADDGEWDLAPEEEENAERKYTEVKIRITKKQLQELLEKADNGKKRPAEKVLADIMNAGEVRHQHREGHWRPALQSIPEVAES